METIPQLNTNAAADAAFQAKERQFADMAKKLQTASKLSDVEKKDFEKAARGFEAMFVNMMMKEMKKGMLEDGLSIDGEEKKGSESFGAETLGPYADMLFSEDVSKSGEGIGLASMIYKNLTGEDLQTLTQQSTASALSVQDYKVPEPAIENENAVRPPLKPREAPATDKKDMAAINAGFQGRLSSRLERYEDIIKSAAARHDVPKALIKAVISAESAGRSDAKSPVGAKGLMQLMDGTARELGVRNSFDPAQNIDGGAKYLKKLLNKFNGRLDHAVAAYNAGPGAVEKYGGLPPYKETMAYVARVKKFIKQYDNEQ
ncbi:MAG: transglycosylase SLT domain-containing protein [Chloroflexota bacterium]